MPTHGHGYVVVVTALTGIVMLATGLWALLAPRSFADFVCVRSRQIRPRLRQISSLSSVS
jgi:hypothetical protein